MARASLLSTFERAARNGVQFSPAERALFQACEFWVAVSARTLAAHLGAQPIDALRYMSIVYLGIEARGVADDMMMAIGELAASSHPQVQDSNLAALQERLLKTSDPVDRLISRLAGNLGLAAKGDTNWICASERALIRA